MLISFLRSRSSSSSWRDSHLSRVDQVDPLLFHPGSKWFPEFGRDIVPQGDDLPLACLQLKVTWSVVGNLTASAKAMGSSIYSEKLPAGIVTVIEMPVCQPASPVAVVRPGDPDEAAHHRPRTFKV
jgi:hypothetical protein